MLKEAINRSLNIHQNEDKKEENLNLSLSLKQNKILSLSKSYKTLKANFTKKFQIHLIDNMNTKQIETFICTLDIKQKNSPNEIINSLLNVESFKKKYQNNIEKLQLIHLNSFQLLINVYNCFDEETELREIICSNEFNKFLYLYLFENSEYYYSIQIFQSKFNIMRLPFFIFTNEQYNTIKNQNKGNKFFEILSGPNEITKSKDINSIKIKPISENIMEYKIKKLMIKV